MLDAHKPRKSVTPTILIDLKKSLPRPLKGAQTAKTCDAHNFYAQAAQACGAHNFHAKKQILTEILQTFQLITRTP